MLSWASDQGGHVVPANGVFAFSLSTPDDQLVRLFTAVYGGDGTPGHFLVLRGSGKQFVQLDMSIFASGVGPVVIYVPVGANQQLAVELHDSSGVQYTSDPINFGYYVSNPNYVIQG